MHFICLVQGVPLTCTLLLLMIDDKTNTVALSGRRKRAALMIDTHSLRVLWLLRLHLQVREYKQISRVE